MTDRLSRDQLADRGGVEPACVDRLVALGILTAEDDGTFAASAHRVVRLVRSFDGSGITPEQIGEAIHAGQLSLAFLDQPSYERFAGLSDTTFQEVSEGSGIPVDLLTMTREAMGYGSAAPEDRIRDDELWGSRLRTRNRSASPVRPARRPSRSNSPTGVGSSASCTPRTISARIVGTSSGVR